MVLRRTSETAIFSSASRSSSSVGIRSSVTDSFRRSDLLLVDLLERGALLEPLDLPFGRVLLRDRKIRSRADLLGRRQHPVHELLESLPRRNRLASFEVEQLAGEAGADRAPEVL